MSVLGLTGPGVSATNHLFNILAIPGGVYRFIREGRMLWPLALSLSVGTFPGVFIGAVIRIELLPDPGNFKIFAGLVLIYIGIRMLKTLLSGRSNDSDTKEKVDINARVSVSSVSISHTSFSYSGIEYRIPHLSLAFISLFIGIVGGAYGIGGGAIIAPILISFYRLPVYTIAGACLFSTFLTSLSGVIFFMILSNYYPGIAITPDWLNGFLLGIGGFAGIYTGARVQKYLPANLIKIILTASIIFIALKYLSELL